MQTHVFSTMTYEDVGKQHIMVNILQMFSEQEQIRKV